MLRQALCIPLAAVLAGSVLNAAPAAEPIVFLNVADLHVTDEASMAEFKQVIAFSNAAIRPAFAYISGDTPDGGTPAQYEAYKRVMDTLQCPVYNVLGDHEARAGGTETYRKVLGSPTYSFDTGKYHVIGLDSMAISDQQIGWARQDLSAARQKGQTNLLFIHHDFAGIKDKSAQEKLSALVKETGVKLVLAGHTHNNIVINDGSCLNVTTTSIHTPKGKDGKGYALVTLDGGRVAWHFVPLDQRPVIATCGPISKLMSTGPEGVVRGQADIRVKAFDTAAIASVTASIDGGATMPLTKGQSGLWTCQWDSSTAKDGEHVLQIEAKNVEGLAARQEIVILTNQAGVYAAAPATVTDAAPGGPGGKGPKEGGPAGKPKKEAIAMDDIPAPAREAITRLLAGVKPEKLEKETKKEGELYVAKWSGDAGESEVKVLADGTLIESRLPIALADLPAEVKLAAEAALPRPDEADYSVKKGVGKDKDKTEYEARAEIAGEKVHLKITADGQVERVGPGAKGPGPKGPKAKPAKEPKP